MENVMEFKEFVERVRKEAEERTQAKVLVQKIQKNNGLNLMGLNILRGDVNVTPTIYLDYYYEDYREIGFEEVFENIMDAYKRHECHESMDLYPFLNFDYARNYIHVRLCNYELNKELLEDVPHLRFLDMAVMFQLMFKTQNNGNASILIRNRFVDIWKKTPEELYEVAMKNMKWECIIESMYSVLSGVGLPLFEEETENQMYVMTNSEKYFGAAYMIMTDKLKEFADENDCEYVVILPSSVHEVLLLPHHSIENVHELIGLVEEVNETQVLREEVLSNNVYVYDRKKNLIEIAE